MEAPISVRTLNDNVISIWVDSAETMNHFAPRLIACTSVCEYYKSQICFLSVSCIRLSFCHDFSIIMLLSEYLI